MNARRIFIYPKEVSMLAGKSLRWAQAHIQVIKIVYNKQKHQNVTIQEYCEYNAASEEQVRRSLENL